jgi:pantothenate kinase-related protein Tda10
MIYSFAELEINPFSKRIQINDLVWISKKEFYNELGKVYQPIQPLKKDCKPKVIADLETWDEKQEREKKEGLIVTIKKPQGSGKSEGYSNTYDKTEIANLLQKAKSHIYFNVPVTKNVQIVRELTEAIQKLKE